MTNKSAFWLALTVMGALILAKPSFTQRGIRNNNPGNIRANPNFTWVGQVGVDDKGFVIFDTAENGIRALYRTLMTYRNRYGINTVHGVLNRYAPSSENDTGSYINHVASRLGVQPDAPLAMGDYPGLVKAIIKHENGVQPYGDETISSGISLA